MSLMALSSSVIWARDANAGELVERRRRDRVDRALGPTRLLNNRAINSLQISAVESAWLSLTRGEDMRCGVGTTANDLGCMKVVIFVHNMSARHQMTHMDISAILHHLRDGNQR